MEHEHGQHSTECLHKQSSSPAANIKGSLPINRLLSLIKIAMRRLCDCLCKEEEMQSVQCVFSCFSCQVILIYKTVSLPKQTRQWPMSWPAVAIVLTSIPQSLCIEHKNQRQRLIIIILYSKFFFFSPYSFVINILNCTSPQFVNLYYCFVCIMKTQMFVYR